MSVSNTAMAGDSQAFAVPRSVVWPVAALVLVFLSAWPLFAPNPFLFTIGTFIVLNAIGATSLHLIIRTGHISLGHAAFMGVGAYCCVIAVTKFGLPPALALVIGMAGAALLALLIGPAVLRLTGKVKPRTGNRSTNTAPRNAYRTRDGHWVCLSASIQKMAERLFRAIRETLATWIERLRAETGDAFPEKVTAFREGMAVHGRFRKPCPVCGSPVQRVRYATNEVNYCATCQTGGRLLADRSLSRLLKQDWPRSLD